MHFLLHFLNFVTIFDTILNKSYQIIQSFNTDQAKNFKLFLGSSYANNRKNLINLFDYIYSHHPDYQNIEFNKSDINKYKLDKKYSDKKYQVKMLSFLFGCIEDFIKSDLIYNENIDNNLTLLTYYNEHHIDKLYLETLQKTKEQVALIRPSSRYHFLINENESSFLSKNDSRKGDVNYLATILSLQHFYIYNMYKLQCLMRNREMVVNYMYDTYTYQNYNYTFIDQMHADAPTWMYFYLYQLFTNSSSILQFEQLIQFIEKQKAEISTEDLGICYSILSNLCRSFYTNSSKEYYHMLFTLYKGQIDSETIYVSNKIQQAALKNCIVLALHNHDYSWAHQFLEQHKSKIIPTETAQEIYYYLLSEINFAEQNFNDALQNLNKSKSEDMLIKLSSKRLFIKIFFELNEFNTFDSYTNAYKVYISRDTTLNENKKEAEKNFVNTILLIQKYKSTNNKEKMHSLISKINSYSQISDKNYLLYAIKKACTHT